MLKSITIENVALIKKAEIELTEGLNVLSGETGAGKSVILESVNFVLGARADKTLICHGEPFCSVTAVFDVFDNAAVKAELENADVAVDDEIVIKRVMRSDGRSTVKLNGEPVTAQMLKRITSLLVDVHGQSDHYVLLKEKNQLELVDELGGERVSAIKSSVSDVLAEISNINKDLSKLGGSDEEREKRLDYLEFCINEIEKTDLKDGEAETLFARRKKLINAEKIAEAINFAVNSVNGDGGVTDVLSDCARAVEGISSFGEEYAEASARLSAVIEELGDVSETLSSSVDEEFDPKEIDYIETRLDEIKRLTKKYGSDYAAVTQKLSELRSERDLLIDGSFEAEKLIAKRNALYDSLNVVFDKLTLERKKTADELSKKLVAKLRELDMNGADFKVEFAKNELVSANGNDDVTFLFTANVGEEMKPLSKIISGGELSRLMLAIKSVSGGAFRSFTYVFDEIDAGISGRAAFTVAENFARIAKTKQIIAVSHLPQIVAMADTSFYIYKKEDGGRTYTVIKELVADERVSEVVRLIGGKGDEASLTHAKNLVADAEAFKSRL